MNPWIGNAIFIAGSIASIGIRWPCDRVSQVTSVVESRKGLREVLLLSLMAIGALVLPLLSFTPILRFSAYQLTPFALLLGLVSTSFGLWLFWRSHADLGRNWSPTLEIRENHRLVTEGVYRAVRHPMYAAIFLLALGQLFLLSNWIAGPAMFGAFTAMFAFRLKPEEKMMSNTFGDDYRAYRVQTRHLIPGIW